MARLGRQQLPDVLTVARLSPIEEAYKLADLETVVSPSEYLRAILVVLVKQDRAAAPVAAPEPKKPGKGDRKVSDG